MTPAVLLLCVLILPCLADTKNRITSVSTSSSSSPSAMKTEYFGFIERPTRPVNWKEQYLICELKREREKEQCNGHNEYPTDWEHQQKPDNENGGYPRPPNNNNNNGGGGGGERPNRPDNGNNCNGNNCGNGNGGRPPSNCNGNNCRPPNNNNNNNNNNGSRPPSNGGNPPSLGAGRPNRPGNNNNNNNNFGEDQVNNRIGSVNRPLLASV